MANSKAVFSWSRGLNGPSVSFEVKYRIGSGSFKTAITNDTVFEIDNLLPESEVRFNVRAVGVSQNN